MSRREEVIGGILCNKVLLSTVQSRKWAINTKHLWQTIDWGRTLSR